MWLRTAFLMALICSMQDSSGFHLVKLIFLIRSTGCFWKLAGMR
jgi:hypothetical protein